MKTLAIELRKEKRTGVIPVLLAVGVLGAAYAFVNFLVRKDTLLNLPLAPMDVLLTQLYGMIMVLNLFGIVVATCMIYNMEFKGSAVKKMYMLPISVPAIYLCKFLILTVMFLVAIVLQNLTLAQIGMTDLPDGAFEMGTLVGFAGYSFLTSMPVQQLCAFLPQAIETILSIFTLFIRVMIPVVLFASTFIATTKVSELIAAMYSLKIPRSITITFAMVLRFFPTFSEEIHNIYDAMKLRGIALSWKNVFTRPVLILEAIAIPIVMRSASIAEELSASAVTRGIDNPAQRTSFIQLKVHAKDWMVLCFFLVAFVVLFFCKYQIYGRI